MGKFLLIIRRVAARRLVEMAHVPFPKLLLRKRLWIGTVSLILVAAFYFYFSFWEVIAWGVSVPRGRWKNCAWRELLG